MKIASFFCLFFKLWFWESCMRTQCNIFSCLINFQSVIKKKVTLRNILGLISFFKDFFSMLMRESFSYADAGQPHLCSLPVLSCSTRPRSLHVSDFSDLPCFPALVSFITWNSETFLEMCSFAWQRICIILTD